MSSSQTPILTSKGLNEEKFQISPYKKTDKIVKIISIIIWCMINRGVFIYISTTNTIIFCIIPGLFVIMGIVAIFIIFCTKDGTTVIIYNMDNTLKLQKISCCSGQTSKIIDLNQVVKISIITKIIDYSYFNEQINK